MTRQSCTVSSAHERLNSPQRLPRKDREPTRFEIKEDKGGHEVLLTDPGTDPRTVVRAVHQVVTAELVRLMDGFYHNIEDGLFELADRAVEDYERRHCFDLMRELRLRRNTLMNSFARVMDRYQEHWFAPASASERKDDRIPELEELVLRMGEKSTAHFGGVLQQIGERASQMTGIDYPSVEDLPISPKQVARAFVVTCRSLQLDTASIELVEQLFRRFVLDGLGGIYGDCNQSLQGLGYLSANERTQYSQQRA